MKHMPRFSTTIFLHNKTNQNYLFRLNPDKQIKVAKPMIIIKYLTINFILRRKINWRMIKRKKMGLYSFVRMRNV